MPRITAEQRNAMFRHLLWLHDHHFTEWLAFHRFGTASDALVQLGQDDTNHAPPFSLATKRGQTAAVVASRQMLAWKDDIPYMAYLLRDELHQVAATAREAKSRVVLEALVEVVLTRAAMERKPHVALCFESIQVAVKALTGEQTGMYLIRSILEHLQRGSKNVEIEFGKRGTFSKSTLIKLRFVTRSSQIQRDAEASKGLVQDWLDEHGHWIVRVHQHEARLKHTLAERKAEYAAKVGTSLDLDEWIRGNTITVGRHHYVNFPCEQQGAVLLLDRVGVEPEPVKPELTMTTPDSMPSDLQRKKSDVPNSTPLQRLPVKAKPWWERKRELQQAGATEAEIMLDGLDLSIPVVTRPTWKQVKAEYERASLERLRQRLAVKGIPWDA